MTCAHHSRTCEDGIALIVALLATLVLSALGLSLMIMASTETLIAGNYRDGVEAFHAADAGLERAIPELAASPDWSAVLGSSGGVRSATPSSFSDATLAALLADGRTMDLVTRTNLLNCPHVFPPAATPCTAAQMDHAAGERPWGSNNPRWRLYANGRLSALAAAIDSPFYVAVWVADDPAENDADPARDGVDTSNPGTGIVQVRSEAFGPGGSRRAVEATVARAGTGLRIISWRLVR
jgi:Tfp pilus assembly protein PilX